MRISITPQPTTLTLETLRTELLQNLRPGQVLRAVALSDNLDGGVRLRIGGSEVVARTLVPMTAGQKLTLSVVRSGPTPELRLLEEVSVRQLQARALKTALPRQLPLSLLAEKLIRLPVGMSQQPLPSAVSKAAENLLHQVVRSDLAALRQSLPTSLSDSGLFLEQRLNQGKSLEGDVKLHLLRWLVLLRSFMEARGIDKTGASSDRPQETTGRPSPRPEQGLPHRPSQDPAQKPATTDPPGFRLLAELVRATEGALARIQVNQLHSLPPGEDHAPQIWQMDLPIRQGDRVDDFRIRFERDHASPEGDARHSWAVTLRFDLEPLGPVQTRLVLRQDRISSTFWAERDHTLELIRSHLDLLSSAFEKAGLEVSTLSVFQGLPAEPVASTFGVRLVDEQA